VTEEKPKIVTLARSEIRIYPDAVEVESTCCGCAGGTSDVNEVRAVRDHLTGWPESRRD
jgi:hypothetical protein